MEEFEEDIPEDSKEYTGPVNMEIHLHFRNERREVVVCGFQKPHEASRMMATLNQAKANSMPSSTVMISDAESNTHLVDMSEVQFTTFKVRAGK